MRTQSILEEVYCECVKKVKTDFDPTLYWRLVTKARGRSGRVAGLHSLIIIDNRDDHDDDEHDDHDHDNYDDNDDVGQARLKIRWNKDNKYLIYLIFPVGMMIKDGGADDDDDDVDDGDDDDVDDHNDHLSIGMDDEEEG